jgi:hypothetical protein
MSKARRSYIDIETTLAGLQKGRQAALAVCAGTKPASDLYNRASALLDAIDDLAEALTGERETFWIKPHG